MAYPFPSCFYTMVTGTTDTLYGTGATITFGDTDDGYTYIPIPFTFYYYGTGFTQMNVTVNGFINFGSQSNSFTNSNLTVTATQEHIVAPYWDDLILNAGDLMYSGVTGSSPNRTFYIGWKAHIRSTSYAVNFEARFLETKNRITFVYGTMEQQGQSATIAIQYKYTDEFGVGYLVEQYLYNTAKPLQGYSINFYDGCKETPPSELLFGLTVNSVWKQANYGYININNVWKPLVREWININNSWKELKTLEPPDTTPPTIGTLSSVVRTNVTTATLTWSAATDNKTIINYKIYRSIQGSDSSFSLLKTVGNVLTTTDNTIINYNDFYYYYVTAIDGNGNESSSSNHVACAALTATNIWNTQNTSSTATNAATYGSDANSTAGFVSGRYTTIASLATDVQNGSYVIKLTSDTTNIQQYRTTNHNLVSGVTYQIKLWAKVSASGVGQIRFSGSYGTVSILYPTTSWAEYVINATAISTGAGRMDFYTAYSPVVGTEWIMLDGIRIFKID